MTNELHLDDTAQAERFDILRSRFNELVGMNQLTLTSKDDFYAVIGKFQQEMKGKYIWSALKNGPDGWKGTLIKVDDASPLTRSFLAHMEMDHKRCDKLYGEGESLIYDGDKDKGAELIGSFVLGMRRHFEMEEKILFATFEQATGMTQGPTMVMRMEHDQMKGLLKQMEQMLESGDYDSIPGVGETLLMIMQQHNIKEESMLYPMMDQHLAGEAPELINKIQAVDYKI